MTMAIIILPGYLMIAIYFLNDLRKGLKVHKASLSYFKWGLVPRFTVRERNGRFKANKVGIFYVTTY